LENGHQHDAQEEKENKMQGFSKNFLLPRSSEPGQLDQIYVNESRDTLIIK
jgi:hypothetical protein